MERAVYDFRGMSKKPRQRYTKLYIGPWLSRLGRRPSEVSKKSGVDEAYLSQLISGEKNNPGAAMLMAISEELGISVNDLYRMPPEHDVTEAITQLRPDQLAVLGELLDRAGKRR